MPPEQAVQEIRLAARRRKRAEKARLKATDDLRELIHAAHDAGVPIAQIAREANLSRQGVYDFLSDPRPSQRA